jgi:hypothetical protein
VTFSIASVMAISSEGAMADGKKDCHRNVGRRESTSTNSPNNEKDLTLTGGYFGISPTTGSLPQLAIITAIQTDKSPLLIIFQLISNILNDHKIRDIYY